VHAAALLAEALWVNYTNGAAPSVVAPGNGSANLLFGIVGPARTTDP